MNTEINTQLVHHERESEHARPRSSDGLKFFDARTNRYLQFRDHHSHRTSSQIITVAPACGIEPTLISPLIALLHFFHGFLGVVFRIKGADQVHLASGLVAEHLATLPVITDIELLGENRRSERRDHNC